MAMETALPQGASSLSGQRQIVAHPERQRCTAGKSALSVPSCSLLQIWDDVLPTHCPPWCPRMDKKWLICDIQQQPVGVCWQVT